MNVEILYFAGAREITGRDNEVADLPAHVTTVAGLLAWLCERYPDLEPYRASLRIARNETFAELDEPLAAGDVLAVIPPVAGG